MRGHGGRRLFGLVAVTLVGVLLVAGLPASAQATDPDPSGPPPPVDGLVFGDRSLIPLAGTEPTGDEVVGERTATSRTFETEIPGVFVTESSLSRLNYRQGGAWRPIDSTLVADGDGGFENAADSTTISMADDAAESTVAEVELADGSSVGFGLDDADPTEPEVSGDTAVYDDVQPGVDLELQSTPAGLKETLVLASSAAPDTYRFPLATTGLTASIDDTGAVVFTDGDGDVRMTIPPGWMEDSAIDTTSGLPATSTGVTYTLVDGGTTLQVDLDRSWMDQPDRVYPLRVDPSLEPTYAHIWSGTDDTYVASTGTATDRSTQYVLKAGYDGTSVYRSFLHFDLSSLEGMNIMGADLAVVQNGSGSCTSSPLDVYEVTEAWTGSATTTWAGQPDVAEDPTATITSGLGHDGSCPYGFAQTDLTRTAQTWVADPESNFGLSLQARDEGSTAQFKQVGSRESYVAPTINVLWSDPTQASAPFDPLALAPREITTTDEPEFSALYQDPEFDEGMVVFFGYYADSGAFAGALTSDEVDAGGTATAAGYLPLDLPIEWRALSVDLVNEVPSSLSSPIPLLHPSVRLVSPVDDDTVSGVVTVEAVLDDSITDEAGVSFALDSAAVSSDTTAPYLMVGPSNSIDDGEYAFTAEIDGGVADGRTSPPVVITIDNEPDDPPGTELAPNEAPRARLRRMLGATDEPATPDPIISHEADCGFSEDLPEDRTLWLFCDRLDGPGDGEHRGE